LYQAAADRTHAPASTRTSQQATFGFKILAAQKREAGQAQGDGDESAAAAVSQGPETFYDIE
jgi:hypothetical protein